MRRFIFFIWLLTLSTLTFSDDAVHSYRPKEGYVPSEQTARTIAEAVLVPIYGKDNISRQKPFKTKITGDIWIIEGSTPADRGIAYLGGSFTIHISKMTGEILLVTHSR